MSHSDAAVSHHEAIQCSVLALPKGAMCYDATRVQHPTPALFDPESPQLNAVAVAQGGRQAAWFVEGDFGRAVLRHYQRGGAIARLSKDRYVWRGANATRSMAEFHILSRMRAKGLAVPRPVAAAYWQSGLFYRAAILIERIEKTHTLTEHVHKLPSPDQSSHQVARAIYAMHEAGFWHADLNAYNILLDHDGKAWLIDFDKAVEGAVSESKRVNNLHRLRRSLRKVAPQTADVWWKDINHAYKALQRGESSTV